MKNLMLFATLALLSAPLFAAYGSCDSEYNDCISNCCDRCGSTLTYDYNGDLACSGNEDNPNEACISACSICSTEYQNCIGSTGSSYDYSGDSYQYGNSMEDIPGAACCGSFMMILATAAFAGYSEIKRKQ
jgi:hypothetical protein